MATNNTSNGKSLNENISDVMNSKYTDGTKKRHLMKLGLRAHEIEYIFALAKAQGSGFDFASLTFGVEIEAYNFTRQSLVDAASANGLDIRSEHYNHQDNEVRYKIVSDASLMGENANEVVSPVLSGAKGLESLKSLCGALDSVNAKVNRSCGLHVHIGAASMTDEHYIRVFKNYTAIEKAIDTFMARSRRGNCNGFCATLQDIGFTRCTTKRDVYDIFPNRYFKVNAHSYVRHQTIEFRQHQGTTDYTKIKAWVMFLAKLVDYSFKHDCPECATIEEIPFLTADEKAYFISRREALS